MLRRNPSLRENWRELYHRIHGPRRLALAKWLKEKEINAQGIPGQNVFPPGYHPGYTEEPQEMNYKGQANSPKQASIRTGSPSPVSINTVQGRHANKENNALTTTSESSAPIVKVRQNRWWVSANGEFIEQMHVIEDPRVIERRKRTLPDPTKEDLWKRNQCPFFTPFEPFVKVMNYPDDPDAKHLYSATIPKWKDFMKRTQPPIPRTWY